MAVEFDGTNDRIAYGDIAAMDGLSAFSVETWVFTDVLTGGDGNLRYIAAKEGGAPAATAFALRLETVTDNWEFVIGGNDYAVAVQSAAADTQIWTHIGGTYDGSNLILYRNGSAGTPVAETLASGDGPNFSIGCRDPGTPDRFFDGKIERLHFYNRALTPAEFAIRAAGYRGPLGGEIFSVSMEDFQGVTHPDGTTLTTSHIMPDLSGNGNDGVPTNSPVARASEAPRW